MVDRTMLLPRRDTDTEPAELACVAPPRDPLALMAAAVLAGADAHVDRMVRRMRAVLPGASDQELRAPAHRHLETAMAALAERREFDEHDAAWWRAVGRQSAKRGLSIGELHDVLSAAHSAVWEIVTESARHRGNATAMAVVSHATTMWQMFDVALSWVSEAHRDVGANDAITFRRRCVNLVAALDRLPDPDAEAEAERIARSLDLDPSGRFLAAVTGAEPTAIDHERGAVVEYGDRTLLLAQPLLPDVAGERAMARALGTPPHHVGIGIQREGMQGAAQSIADATMAFEACGALGADVVVFRDDWLQCIALANREHQEALVADAVHALRADPHAGATLVAFFAADGNLAAAAAALAVHPNTVAYRIRQFAERTGVDVRTTAGAALGRVALTMAGVLPEPPAAAGRAAS